MLARELNRDLIHKLAESYPEIIQHIGRLNPQISRDGDSYCCLSGDDPMEGNFGCGPTEKDALEDWERDCLKKIKAI